VSRTPTRGSSVALFFLSLPFLAIGLLTAPWADAFFWRSRELFQGQAMRDAGDFASGVSSFFLLCGVLGVGYAVVDFVRGPPKT
jgi:hypothetical protein